MAQHSASSTGVEEKCGRHVGDAKAPGGLSQYVATFSSAKCRRMREIAQLFDSVVSGFLLSTLVKSSILRMYLRLNFERHCVLCVP